MKEKNQSLRFLLCNSETSHTTNTDVPMRGSTNLGQHHGSCGEPSRPGNRMEQTNSTWDELRKTTGGFLRSRTAGCPIPNDWYIGNFQSLRPLIQSVAGN